MLFFFRKKKKVLKKVIFKFDDLIDCSSSVLWMDEFIHQNNLKITWGIIGKSLDEPNKDYIDFIRKKLNDPLYHFFNHGYYHSLGPVEFRGNDENYQIELIMKTQNLFKKLTGQILDTFGSPGNAKDENTVNALNRICEIKYWYFGFPNFERFSFPRILDMEKMTGKPSFKFFKKEWQKKSSIGDIFVLEGHPCLWQERHFDEFKKIVYFLKKNAEFVFPTDV